MPARARVWSQASCYLVFSLPVMKTVCKIGEMPSDERIGEVNVRVIEMVARLSERWYCKAGASERYSFIVVDS